MEVTGRIDESRPCEARRLVCKDCWDNVFTTQQYKKLCLRALQNEEAWPLDLPVFKSMNCISVSASDGCTFCTHLQGRFFEHLKGKGQDEQLQFILRTQRYANYHFPHRPSLQCFLIVVPDTRGPCTYNLGENTPFYLLCDEFDTAISINNKPVIDEVDNPQAYGEILGWLHQCTTSHEDCDKLKTTPLPTRILEVSPKQHPSVPRVINTGGQSASYIALSYSWGCQPSNLLTRKTLSQYLKGIDMHMLPQTFQDAIKVAKRLSIPFLWIDGLCILQDSEEDLAHELANMTKIYENSLFTIVAANAEDVHQGLFHDRSTLSQLNRFDEPPSTRPFRLPFRETSGLIQTVTFALLKEQVYEEGREPINTRAWTLQEQIMAPRLLRYASHTLQWVCNNGTQNLGKSLHMVPTPSREVSSLSNLNTVTLVSSSVWRHIVEVYSRRAMSKETDKLVAIGGLARRYSTILGHDYFAGLWRTQFTSHLTWRADIPPKFLSNERFETRSYIAPSWSWASGNFAVRFPRTAVWDNNHPTSLKCELVQCILVPKPFNDLFGEIVSGYVILDCHVLPAWYKHSSNPDDGSVQSELMWLDADSEDQTLQEAERVQRISSEKTELFAQLETPLPGMDITKPIFVHCLLLSVERNYVEGLMLVEVENGLFKRVGHVSTERWEEQTLKRPPMRRIKII